MGLTPINHYRASYLVGNFFSFSAILEMALHIILGIITLVFHCASAQFGSCSITDFSGFVAGLPNNCGSTVFTVFNPSDNTTPEQLDRALATFCRADCGELVIDYLLSCDSVGIALSLNLYCLPTLNTSNLGNYCRSSLPDQIDVSIINLLAPCADFSVSGTCSGACAAGLTAARNAIGCCYQNVYNNTGVLNGYLQGQIISQQNITLLTNVISNFSLWSECGVIQVDRCSGYPFPGRPTEIGVCTNEQIDEHMATLSDTCQVFALAVINLNTSSYEKRTNFDNLCTNECGGSISDFQNVTCRNDFLSALTQEACLQTNGSLGDHCFFSLPPSADQLLADAIVCVASSANNCPSGCAAALQALSSSLGCCYQNIYNNTQFLDALLVYRNQFTADSVTFFKILGNYKLWDVCGIPLVEECQGKPFTDGAVKLTTPIIIWILVQVVTILLY